MKQSNYLLRMYHQTNKILIFTIMIQNRLREMKNNNQGHLKEIVLQKKHD